MTTRTVFQSKTCRCCGDLIAERNASSDEAISRVYQGRCKRCISLFQQLMVRHVDRNEPVTPALIWAEVFLIRVVDKAPNEAERERITKLISETLHAGRVKH